MFKRINIKYSRNHAGLFVNYGQGSVDFLCSDCSIKRCIGSKGCHSLCQNNNCISYRNYMCSYQWWCAHA